VVPGASVTGTDSGIGFFSGTVTNFGSITGGINGISATTATVTNSGIISGGAAALLVSVNPDTLTLLPGSTIIGAIKLGGGGDTVNFRTGNQNLTFDTLTGATVTSTVPLAVSGNRVVTIDPTPFALADRAVMDFSRAVSFALPDIGTAGTTQTASADASNSALGFAGPGSNASLVADEFARIPGLSTYAEASSLPALTAVYGNGTAVWTRGFAGKRVQDADGSLLHADNRFFGGLIGGSWQAQPNLRVGAFLGAGETRSSLDFSYGGVNSTLLFGGLFARYDQGASFLKVILQGGHSNNDSTRKINNNLVAGGIETATASYDGWYIAPEATFGHRFALGSYAGGLYTLTPSLTVRYLHVAFDGYTEKGTTAPLTVGSRNADDFEERGELKLARTQMLASGATLTTDLFGGIIADQRNGKTINATVLGQAIPFATPGDDNVWGGLIGGGLEWRDGRMTLYARADYLALSDHSSVVEGLAGLRVSF
jgi:hypothetical protein